jgi:hypothetical protein
MSAPTAALGKAKFITPPYGRSRVSVNRTETRHRILRWRTRQLPQPNLDPVAPCAIPSIHLGRQLVPRRQQCNVGNAGGSKRPTQRFAMSAAPPLRGYAVLAERCFERGHISVPPAANRALALSRLRRPYLPAPAAFRPGRLSKRFWHPVRLRLASAKNSQYFSPTSRDRWS